MSDQRKENYEHVSDQQKDISHKDVQKQHGAKIRMALQGLVNRHVPTHS